MNEGHQNFVPAGSLVTLTRVNVQAFEELERLFAKSGICVAVKEKLTKDSGVAEAFAYDHIVNKLLEKPKARGKLR